MDSAHPKVHMCADSSHHALAMDNLPHITRTKGAGMKIFVQIDLSEADITEFEDFETRVLALLPRHGGSLLARVRSKDGNREFHLLGFPDAVALAAFRSDPARLEFRSLWERCGATSTLLEVEDVG